MASKNPDLRIFLSSNKEPIVTYCRASVSYNLKQLYLTSGSKVDGLISLWALLALGCSACLLDVPWVLSVLSAETLGLAVPSPLRDEAGVS